MAGMATAATAENPTKNLPACVGGQRGLGRHREEGWEEALHAHTARLHRPAARRPPAAPGDSPASCQEEARLLPPAPPLKKSAGMGTST